ncbi:hypothetical protein [Paenibacillus odorifer]|uniref:hypothetical protein n=1 Tax=Paenibacillus odorifer TaxID=189426 RepID=UPI00096D4B64|nr:hypothetical protein [Paenibacillus odorifer]OMD92785.1 hypothetical protein BSK67_18660 [Paenibacillus odorifer]
MRQSYYGVDGHVYHELKVDLALYSKLTRELFNKETSQEQKAVLKHEKDELQQSIQDCLTSNGEILGFLKEVQIEQVEKAAILIENEGIRALLGSNLIPLEHMGELISTLMEINSPESPASLIYILEKAKQNQQHIVVWIM